MAKGRKLTISRSERFLGSYHDTGVDEGGVELGEDDVWSMVDDMVNGGGIGDDRDLIESEWTPRAVVMPPTRRRGGGLRSGSPGGLSVAFDDQEGKMVVASQRIVHQFRNGGDSLASPRGRHIASSAPVNVPDWSKIYRVDSVESIRDSDDGTDDHDSDMVPPHEYLARSHRTDAKSVFEGVGRTLKGRDLSRVRDAVWSQTGFDG